MKTLMQEVNENLKKSETVEQLYEEVVSEKVHQYLGRNMLRKNNKQKKIIKEKNN
jgi:hypothetical protein